MNLLKTNWQSSTVQNGIPVASQNGHEFRQSIFKNMLHFSCCWEETVGLQVTKSLDGTR